MKQRPVFQFKITLDDVFPKVWRRIQISDLCTFWSLHVAIQDAMGWTDSHLHNFEVRDPVEGTPRFMGIPCDDEFSCFTTEAGWDHKVRDFLDTNSEIAYLYDYGDGWEHTIQFEGEKNKQSNKRYPICLDGENACPPEDVGGSVGYENFLSIISDPEHEEREDMLDWVGEHFDPLKFSPKQVRFESPSKRKDVILYSTCI